MLTLIGTVVVLLLVQPNQACIPAPQQCTNTVSASLSPGKAPLYNAKPDGNNNYIIVIEDNENPEAMKKKIGNMRSSSNKRISPGKALNGPPNGIKAVVSDLDDQQLDMIREMDGVKYVEKNLEVKMDADTNVWGLDRIDQRNLPLDKTYSPSGNGDDVIVYVVDSGVNTNHVEFGGRAVNWHEVVTATGEDCNGHGTHVAGTVAAATYGVASNVMIHSVRVFGCGTTTSVAVILAGINHILENGVSGSVVSMSLGGAPSVALDDAVKNLISAEFVVVVAAGNDNIDACEQSPARVPDAITVGATNSLDTRAVFSNYGIGVDIFAPGVNIESLDNSDNIGTSTLSGTSMSTPHVAGLAAILLSKGTLVGNVRQQIIDLSTTNVVNDPNGSHNRLLFIE